MFYSTDLLVRKDARFALIWRLAISRGHGSNISKKSILSIDIGSIVNDIQQRIPSQRATKQMNNEVFSLYLIGQLLYGTCIVFRYQVNDLQDDARMAWQACRHIRFDERTRSTRKPREDKEREAAPWDDFNAIDMDGPAAKKRRRQREEIDRDEHNSQIVLGMEYMDRLLVNSVSNANITLQDPFIPTGINDSIFLQNDPMDLQTVNADLWDEFYRTGETVTTREASGNSREDIANLSDVVPPTVKRSKLEMGDQSEVMEGPRAGSRMSHFSNLSNTHGLSGGPLLDINLNGTGMSMEGVESEARTSMPQDFIDVGPVNVSTQVDRRNEPIFQSEPSQILHQPFEHDVTLDAALLGPADLNVPFMDRSRTPSIHKDVRVSGGSDQSRNNLASMVDMIDGDVLPPLIPSRMNIPSIDEGTPKRGKKRVLDKDDEEIQMKKEVDDEEVERDTKKNIIRPRKLIIDQYTTLTAERIKENLADYSDTHLNYRDRLVTHTKGYRKKESAAVLFQMNIGPNQSRTHPNRILNDLYKKLKLSEIVLRDDDDSIDDLLEDDMPELIPLEEILEGEREEVVEGVEDRKKSIIGDTTVFNDNEPIIDPNLNVSNRFDDMIVMDTTEPVNGVHISRATIEGDWNERHEYVDMREEREYIDREKEFIDRSRRRGDEEEEDELEEARRRRTDNTWDMPMDMNYPSNILIDPMYDMTMKEERDEEGMRREREEEISMIDKYENRYETEMRVPKEKRNTMAAVDHHEARQIIKSKCAEYPSKQATLSECIPRGANRATASRFFYNLLVLAKHEEVVPEQLIPWDTITIGLIPPHSFPVYEDISV